MKNHQPDDIPFLMDQSPCYEWVNPLFLWPFSTTNQFCLSFLCHAWWTIISRKNCVGQYMLVIFFSCQGYQEYLWTSSFFESIYELMCFESSQSMNISGSREKNVCRGDLATAEDLLAELQQDLRSGTREDRWKPALGWHHLIIFDYGSKLGTPKLWMVNTELD